MSLEWIDERDIIVTSRQAARVHMDEASKVLIEVWALVGLRFEVPTEVKHWGSRQQTDGHYPQRNDDFVHPHIHSQHLAFLM